MAACRVCFCLLVSLPLLADSNIFRGTRAAPLEPAVDFRGSDPPKRKAPAPAKEKLMIPTFAAPDEPAAGRRVSAASVLHELGGGEDPDDETLDDMRAKAKKARVA